MSDRTLVLCWRPWNRCQAGNWVQVHGHWGKPEYEHLMRAPVAARPPAKRIILVQDNLNTHGPGCFYEFHPAREFRGLSKRFELHFTPKKSSWLNMADIELSAMSKQCRTRRIGSIGKLRAQVTSWGKRRNRERAKINWQFTSDKARAKLHRHYQAVPNKMDGVLAFQRKLYGFVERHFCTAGPGGGIVGFA